MDSLVKFLILIFIFRMNKASSIDPEESERNAKILPVFQVVRFPNDGCIVSGGTKNGTCYTTEECSSKGGVNGGSCASGFGVCCTFSVGCGSSSSENCTYFEVVGGLDGPCVSKICKVNSNICQIRLDLTTFVITGPSTNTGSVGKQVNGNHVEVGGGKLFSQAGSCLTDVFTVSGSEVPPLCGTLSGEHIYFDASDDCHELNFGFGQAAIGVTSKESSRRFSIKASQISCNSDEKAPAGCLQWYTGEARKTGTVENFNFSGGKHLADQKQHICFRREQGNCRICFTGLTTDFALGGKAAKGVVLQSSCCGYGQAGIGTTGPYDCVVVPGAQKHDEAIKMNAVTCIAGGAGGLVSATGTGAQTLCSKTQPFKISFISDALEEGTNAIDGGTKGFKVTYWQEAC